MIYILQHFAVAVSAVSGVLAARGRGVDLFGVIVLALVTAFGGGTIRDLCLGATPVFWIGDSNYIVTVLIAAVVTFILARWVDLPRGFLEISDALGLAMFTVIGAQKSLQFGTGPLVAVALGTMTGVAGGICRDVLLTRLPDVFRKEVPLYATAAISGAVAYLVARHFMPAGNAAAIIGTAVTFLVRLLSIRLEVTLPAFRSRE